MLTLTHSLLSSWQHMLTAYDPEAAMDGFMKSLRKEPVPVTDAMQNGLDFERDVYAIASGGKAENESWSTAATAIARKIEGGQIQVKTGKVIKVARNDVWLYGVLDVLKAGIIYDVKFSRTYEAGKFLDSTQHPAYFVIVPEARRFDYLISNGQDVWTETYRPDGCCPIEQTIADFWQWIVAAGLWDEYASRWQTEGDNR